MIKKYLEKTIYDYFKKYIDDKNTLAIVITGSYGRGENDELSDIDWVRIVLNKNDKNISGFKENFKEILFDCRIEQYDLLARSAWCMDQYYAYLNCKLYYELNNIFSNLQLKKRQDWNEYIKKFVAIRLVECSVFLKFPVYFFDLKTNSTHFERFIFRNDFYSAYNCLKVIENQLIDLCYVSNNIQIPDIKNKMRNINKYQFSNLLKESCIIINGKNLEELEVAYNKYKKVLKKILKCVNKNFTFNESLKVYYYKYRGGIR